MAAQSFGDHPNSTWDITFSRRAATEQPGPERTGSPALRPEMLRELQALGLVVRADAFAVKLAGPRQHPLIDQAPDGLAVLEDERHLARAHFEHGARAPPARARMAEAGIEEAGVMHPELADQRIERHHLGGVIG